MNNNWVYDIETMINFFCAVFRHKEQYKVFEISDRKDDTKLLVEFLNSDIDNLIGFNNVRFDMQVLQLMLDNLKDFNTLKPSKKAEKCHEWAQDVIRRSRDNEFPPYPEYELSIPQIDPYLIHHYNNKNKSTSLKWLEFSMNWHKVQDLPYKHDEFLTVDKFDEVIEYCINDVDATHLFAKKSMKLIQLRLSQNEDNEHLGLKNKSDSSVGETLFLHYMSEALNIDKKKLKEQQTHHNKIHLRECIIPYINFKTDTFKKVLNHINTISIIGGGNTDFKYEVRYDSINYVFGEGGLHASQSNKIFETNDEYSIIDIDVKSYYPNLAIRNKFYPQHLSEEFCQVYEDIYNTRVSIPKSDPRNYSYKIILNGVYGKSKDSYSFLYDQKFQLQITVNGQLLLAMLVERLSFINDCEIIQVNTDGVTVRIKNTELSKFRKICKKWEKLTNLELEEVEYSKMVVTDVNNYIAQYKDGSFKAKGRYEIDVEFHKNRSQRIVPIALKRYFLDGIPVKKTIETHLLGNQYGSIENQGIFDFCIGRKIRHNQNYVVVTSLNEEIPITDKVIRYFISNDRNRMLKKYSDGRVEAVNKGYDVTMLMEFDKNYKGYNVDYNYYINECNKLITPIMGGNDQVGLQKKLF